MTELTQSAVCDKFSSEHRIHLFNHTNCAEDEANGAAVTHVRSTLRITHSCHREPHLCRLDGRL